MRRIKVYKVDDYWVARDDAPTWNTARVFVRFPRWSQAMHWATNPVRYTFPIAA